MTKNYLKMIAALALLMCGMTAVGQTLTNEATSALWALDLGTEGQTPTFSPETTSAYFKNAYVTNGSSLSYGSKTVDGKKQTTFKPKQQDGSANDDNAVEFIIVPKTGLNFTPTEVSLQSTRYGTDGGKIDIAWINADGTTISLATGVTPNRDNKGDSHISTYSYTLTDAQASDGACGIRVNIYSLGNTKQYGFNDITITGKLNGTTVEVKQCTLAVGVNPEGAGTVKQLPVGDTFDENTEISLTQTRNFGYKFRNWTDSEGNVLSTADELTCTLTKDMTITANYDPITTYSLTYSANGGAKDYMIATSPEPQQVEGKNMYEEGTVVTLSASSNKILSFTGWSNGETSSETKLTMDKDQTIAADYSAIDFIAAWDFHQAGNAGRVADFASADNDAAALVMRDADNNQASWLDKSQVAAGGYEGKPAAVNWTKSGELGKYYWQTKVNAEAFTNIKVSSAMLYNYNAYTKYNVEYSLDGDNWTKVGCIEMPGAKAWTDSTFTLPADADNQNAVYIRWIADRTAPTAGTTSDNDGISIADIAITATAKVIDDGTAPKLMTSLPENGSTTASANGKIVLTFDEKVKVAEGTTATLNGMSLSPVVVGKTVTFEYKGLPYSTNCIFTLPANSVADLTDNYIDQPITFTFTTKARPSVAKALFDFIVPDNGTFKEAIAAAAKRTDTSKRFRIFIKKGDYTIPADETATVEGSDGVKYPSPITTIATPNISIIGEDMAATTITNTVPTNLVDTKYGQANPIEGLGKCETIELLKAATNTYMQDLTIKSGLTDATGRGAALEDESDKTICKNVTLHGYQDTYLSNNEGARFYFEGGRLRGRTDFLCGKGDVFYNGVEIVMCEKGGYVTAPSKPKKYGYVFKDCVIKGESSSVDGNFTLGRPWGQGTPICLYIDTRMEAKPSATGWNEMSGGYPARFAEYNSTTASGTTIDLSNRKTTFADTHTNNPVLTAEEAAQMSLATVMGNGDDWDPTAATEQTAAPTGVQLYGTTLTWDASDYALCWAICKNGNVVDFTTTNTYTIDDATATYSVRAANEMGGLGEAAKASITTGVDAANKGCTAIATSYYDLKGMPTTKQHKGIAIKVERMANGSQVTTKEVR